MRRSSLVLVALTVLALVGTGLYSQGQTHNQSLRPVGSRTDEMLAMWNSIGNKLIAMAQDFPEDKYDFKLQKDQRTFAQTLLHVAGVDYLLVRTVSGSNLGPDLGKDVVNPSRDVYKTKAEVVNLLREAVADGANLIQQQGDVGLDKTTKFPFGDKVVHNSYCWMFVVEDSGEHYGQLVAYYRANNMVPPQSRPR
jgi:uncharacterized damage-inducible protein DinB